MKAPWNYRPIFPATEMEEDPLDWDDNVLSNSMAWASDTFLPRWCKTEGHWTARLADKFWAECSCCLFFRGMTVGAIAGAALASVVALLV